MTELKVGRLTVIGIGLLGLGGCARTDAVSEDAKGDLQLGSPPILVADDRGPSAVPGITADSAALAKHRLEALRGDPAAAYELVRHYDLVGNAAQADVWVHIGAENGEYNSMVSLGFQYERQKGIEGCVRAVYWLTRAKSVLNDDRMSPDLSDVQKAETSILIEGLERDLQRIKSSTGC